MLYWAGFWFCLVFWNATTNFYIFHDILYEKYYLRLPIRWKNLILTDVRRNRYYGRLKEFLERPPDPPLYCPNMHTQLGPYVLQNLITKVF